MLLVTGRPSLPAQTAESLLDATEYFVGALSYCTTIYTTILLYFCLLLYYYLYYYESRLDATEYFFGALSIIASSIAV